MTSDGNSEDVDTAEVLSSLENIIEAVVLTEDQLNSVAEAITDLPLNDAEQKEEVLNLITTGGMKTLLSSETGAAEVVIDTPLISATFVLDTAEGLAGSEISTSSGSGVVLPANLIPSNDSNVPSGTTLVINVV